MKLLRQPLLTEFHKWLKNTIEYKQAFTYFSRRWNTGSKYKFRTALYLQYLDELKTKQQEQLEQEFWREIHGD